jgi:8-oxo-dGTP pyrophosphatase MutT (NUDIX family)
VEPEETIQAAALREAAEEVGVNPDLVRVLGTLSTLYIPVSDFALHPVVGIADHRPIFQKHSGEVGRILEISLDRLWAPSGSPRRGAISRDSGQVLVPYFELNDERVWGATAMILAELLAVLGTTPVDPWEDHEEANGRNPGQETQ